MEEARVFLESASHESDPLYAAYVLVLVLGLRCGEALGLTWRDVNLDAAEMTGIASRLRSLRLLYFRAG